ncbi:MAG: hypothetical protein ACNA78_07790 [Balneolaceae bacterium]
MDGMHHLSIDLFTRVRDDLEKRQYLIQADLGRIRANFKRYSVYPYLGELTELWRTLQTVLTRLNDLSSAFPKKIKKIDWVNQTIEHDVIFVDGTDITAVKDLIEWALPHIEQLLQEGAAIHEFVESELVVEHVGILPAYRDEGYFFLPDNESNKLQLHRFELSVFQSADDAYRTLKTRLIRELNRGPVEWSPNSLKLELIREEKELPNPATYAFETTLDFSFRHTIFPIAKRKLMQHLHEA